MSEINKITYEEIYQEGFNHGLIYKNKVNKELEADLARKEAEIKSLSENFGLLNIECLKLTAELKSKDEMLKIAVETLEDEYDEENVRHSHIKRALDKIKELNKE